MKATLASTIGYGPGLSPPTARLNPDYGRIKAAILDRSGHNFGRLGLDRASRLGEPLTSQEELEAPRGIEPGVEVLRYGNAAWNANEYAVLRRTEGPPPV